jgi:hypothetical protein
LFGKLGDLTVIIKKLRKNKPFVSNFNIFKQKFNRIHYHTLFFLSYGLVQLTIPFAKSFYILLAQSALLGIFDGVYLSFIVPICFDITKSSTLANQAAGFHHFIISIPSVTGPVLAGKLYEIYNNYTLAFYIGGSTCLVGAFMQFSSIMAMNYIFKRKSLKG